MQKTEQIWYFEFDSYFDGTEYPYTLRWDADLKKWFLYENGVFRERKNELVEQIIFDWDLWKGEGLTPSKLTLLIKRLKAKCLLMEEWDADPNIDNCLNGLVNKTTRKLLPHTYDYPSREQIARNYIESDGIIPEKFEKLVSVIKNDTDRANFIKFLVNVVHRKHEDELFCILYGPKGAGKSTVLQIFELLFGRENVSKTRLQKIGKRFGLKELYNKRVNVNPDLPIVPMTDNTISLLKQLTGNDGMIEVEFKGKDSFTYPIRCFLVFGINQLMGFKATSEQEIESVFRRALLIHINETLKRDSKFKKSLEKPEFLDALYSWLVWKRPMNIIEDDSIDDWVDSQKEKWLSNSNPILAICKELYIYYPNTKLGAREVQDEIRSELEDDGKLTNHQLQTNITQALQTMKIYRDNGRGTNGKYENIKRVADLTQDERDALDYETFEEEGI